jgi:uncharacterized membrane protein (DUF485 family)
VYPDTVLYVKRIGLLSVMTLAALNIWTGAPLLAVWVGSRVVATSQPTMGAIFLVIVVLFASCIGLIYVLNNASMSYDELTGRKQQVRRHVPWLRSMRAERVEHESEKVGMTSLERLLVAMVVLAVTLFEIWFFFFSPSPI